MSRPPYLRDFGSESPQIPQIRFLGSPQIRHILNSSIDIIEMNSGVPINMQRFSYIKWDSKEQLVSTRPRKSSAQHSSNHWAQHICSTHLIHHIISFSPVTTIPKLHDVGKFQSMHEVDYGLKISACHPSSGNVSFFSLLRYVRSRRAFGG
jgi:hypothetical protein